MILARRRGFAMITILWVMTVAGVMATAAALAGRNTVHATRNRVQLERAFWVASGCAALAQAAIDDRLAEATSYEDAGRIWRGSIVPSFPSTLPDPDACTCCSRRRVRDSTSTRPPTKSSPISSTPWATVAMPQVWSTRWPTGATPTVLRGPSEPSATGTSPRNAIRRATAPFADIRELARVRGFESLAPFDSLLTVESGRISLATAPVTVLMSVPGFTRETAEIDRRDARRRHAGERCHLDTRRTLANFGRCAARSVCRRRSPHDPDPDAWLLTVHARWVCHEAS